MFLGKVVGTLVATQKEASLEGLKFLVVRRLTVENEEESGYVVAADAVGAGIGEVVMVATGSSARQTRLTDKRPCDAVVMAIVDTWEVGGQAKYQK
ncbi:MAG: EutN/CcmL family microcompartment protein [Ardenticatenaceae bacterium]|nr:EutN/CcmL family microcompartment protein [Ardenticatenaceae bacterium]